MSKFKHIVDFDANMEGFRAKYHISQGVPAILCFRLNSHKQGGRRGSHSYDRFHRRRNDNPYGQGDLRLSDPP